MTLYLECKPDEALAVALGVAKRNITHYQGKDRVCHFLKRIEAGDGMVDEDPYSAQPSYMKALAAGELQHGLKLLRDGPRKNRMIVICPKLEDWLIETARQSGVKMPAFNLSEDAANLHSEINYRLENVQKLVAELIEKRSPRLLYLKSLLTGEFKRPD